MCTETFVYTYYCMYLEVAQNYARVSRDTNYLPIIIKRAKRDRAKRSACVGFAFSTQMSHYLHTNVALGLYTNVSIHKSHTLEKAV